ncbi:MAG: helix-turn-helix domain-containing protein [Patescibacteria group bacterium]|nr:helix-turn-helix domain-containing protein [Patescibacteria group bacterium]
MEKIERQLKIRNLRKKYFKVDNIFLDDYAQILGVIPSMVYVYLCRCAGNIKQECWPSQKKLAEELALSRPSVNKAIKILEYFGFITKIRVGRHCNNRYYLLDKEYWNKDHEMMLKRLTEGDVKEIDVRSKQGLIQRLTRFISIERRPKRKETQEKEKEISTTPKININSNPISLDRAVIDKSPIVLKADIISSDIEAANYLWDCIKERLPNFKEPNLDDWADEISKMRRIDKRPREEIMGAIEWAQQNNFWQSNILSPVKLRKHFDMMQSQAMSKTSGSKISPETLKKILES